MKNVRYQQENENNNQVQVPRLISLRYKKVYKVAKKIKGLSRGRE